MIFRNATIFGLAPRMRFDLAVNIMTLRAWKDRVIYVMGGGQQWRPFIHVDDVVGVLVQGLEADADIVSGEIFNVGDEGMNYQIAQLAELVLDVIPNVTVHNIRTIRTSAPTTWHSEKSTKTWFRCREDGPPGYSRDQGGARARSGQR